jgi:hypothetical protein
MPGWVNDDAFLAGYGAAQAVPGPLFTFAAYLGAVVKTSPHGLTGAALADRHFSSRCADPDGHIAFLGVLPEACRSAGCDARRQRGRGRPARRDALQPGLDELRQNARGFWNHSRRLCIPHRLARAAAGCRHHQRWEESPLRRVCHENPSMAAGPTLGGERNRARNTAELLSKRCSSAPTARYTKRSRRSSSRWIASRLTPSP